METKFKIGDRVRQNNVPKGLPNPVFTIYSIEDSDGIMCYKLNSDGFYLSSPVDSDNLELVEDK